MERLPGCNSQLVRVDGGLGMEWKTDSKLENFYSFPYKVEKFKGKYNLYRHYKITDHWVMRKIGRYERPEDAMLEAEYDSKQGTLGV